MDSYRYKRLILSDVKLLTTVLQNCPWKTEDLVRTPPFFELKKHFATDFFEELRTPAR